MIAIRPVRGEDADALYPLLMGSNIPDTLLWDGPPSLAGYRESLGRFADRVARGESLHFAILAGERPVGCVGVLPVDGFRGEIGLWIGCDFQRRGVGTAAVGLAVRAALARPGIDKLQAGVFVGNLASRRVLEKNGFILEGTLRRSVRKRGRYLDEWRFGLLREEAR